MLPSNVGSFGRGGLESSNLIPKAKHGNLLISTDALAFFDVSELLNPFFSFS